MTTSCSEHKGDSEVSFSEQSIVGGELVKKNEFKGVVAIVRNGDIICSGVAISEKIVMTAAHCLVDQSPHAFRVYLGNGVKLPSKRYVKGQFRVEKFLLHPKLKTKPGLGIINFGDYNANDVGLLFLDRPLPGTQVYKIASNVELIRKHLIPGTETLVVGYGYTGEDSFFEFEENFKKVEYGLKRKVEIPLVDFNNNELDIRSAGKDSCYVDSGGPAFIKNGDDYEIFGIVSGSEGLCGEDEFPVYYALAFDSLCWIVEQAGIEADDIAFHCKRNEIIEDSCTGLSKKEGKACATKLSHDIIFYKGP